MHELSTIPHKIEHLLKTQEKHIEQLAHKYHRSQDFLFLGRGVHYPIALEGALKLKEISYIHAEGYPAGEMKHGPIALIDPAMPVVALTPRDSSYDRMMGTVEEVRARDGRIIALAYDGDREIGARAWRVLTVPAAAELLSPILMAIPLQLLAYHVAVRLGRDVDQIGRAHV